MSWSVSMIGHPEKISAALDRQSEGLSGESKKEFDDVLPHLKALLAQNFQKQPEPYCQPVMQLEANGHGYTKDGERVYCNASVRLTGLSGTLV